LADTTFLFDPPERLANAPSPPGNSGGSDYVSLPARRQLADCVQAFWYYESAGKSPVREHVLPTGAMGLFFDLTGAGSPQVSGACSRSTAGETAGPTALMGVQFRPGGAAAFLGMPAAEVCEAHVDLANLWGRQAGQLQADLQARRSTRARFALLERALLARCAEPPLRSRAVRFAVEQLDTPTGTPSIAGLAALTGLTSRRLISLFRDQVGLPPKLYGRVRRLQQAIGLAAAQDLPRWTEIALDTGFYDQSHLVHEFQELLGQTPTAFAGLLGRHASYAC